MSTAERVLWSRLRDGQVGGFKFRRQHPLGPYVADFYCHQAGLVVETDGRFHETKGRWEEDRERDRWMKTRGVEVYRISASLLGRNLDGVLQSIERVCTARVAAIAEFRRGGDIVTDRADPL